MRFKIKFADNCYNSIGDRSFSSVFLRCFLIISWISSTCSYWIFFIPNCPITGTFFKVTFSKTWDFTVMFIPRKAKPGIKNWQCQIAYRSADKWNVF